MNSGDRDHYFGERQPANTFDVNGSASTGFSVVNADYLNSQNKLSVWLVLNDTNPDTVNGGPSANLNELKAGTNVVARTRIDYLYASANSETNEAASVGILFGLTGTGATRSGYLARVDRPNTPSGGTSGSRLVIDEFTNGVRGASVAVSSDFGYGANSSDHFLELRITSDGITTNATVKLFRDADIPGTGFDSSRLVDAAFDMAVPQASVTGALGNYNEGFLALYGEDNSNMTTNNPANGVIRLSNFYANFDVPPPTESFISLAATTRLAIEGGSDAAFTLTRGGKTNAPVTVNYTLGGTASNGVDYATLSGNVSFAPGQTESVLYINAPDDSTAESNETVTLTLQPDSEYEIVGLGSSSVVITDPNPIDYSLLSFNDEFNGTALDTALWHIHSGRTNIAVQNGMLELITGKEGDDWKTGSIQTTDFAGKYGYYEARLKVNDASGLNNAFWLNTPGDLVSGNSVDRMEVDITEAHYNDNQSHMTLHDWAPVHWGTSTSATIPDISADFNAVGLEWKSDNTLVWSWDGVEMRTVNASTVLSADSMIPLSVLFSTKVLPFAGAPGSGLEGSKMLVDYVRVWQKPGWTGAVNGNWGSAPNWGPDSLPGSGKAAVFNGPSANTSVTLAADKSCHSLYFDNETCPSYTLAAGAYDLHLGAAVDGVGGITINTPVISSQTINLNLVADRGLQFGNFSRTTGTELIFNGDTDATASDQELQFCGFSTIRVNGAFSANIGPVTKWGANTVHFTGANAHSGITDVQDGALVAGSSSALGSTASGTLVSSGASMVFAGGVQYTNAEPVTLSGTGDAAWQGALDVDGSGSTLFRGPITLNANVTLAGGTNGCELELAGSISGAFSITKAGAGVLTLSGNNAYSGATTVSAGKLILNGMSASAVTASGGTLGGVGVISNNVTITSGIHAPGRSAGNQTIYGSYTLAAGGALRIDINGTTPGAEHDRVRVLGGNANTVTLTGSLQMAALPGLPLGAVLTVIENDGTDAVSGTFAGMTNNSTFSADGYTWRVNYDGGDGNEVTLTILSGTQPSLNAEVAAGALLVSWPDPGSVYSLQGTTNLTLPTTWMAVTNPVVISNGTFRVLVPYDGSRRFFRLVWP